MVDDNVGVSVNGTEAVGVGDKVESDGVRVTDTVLLDVGEAVARGVKDCVAVDSVTDGVAVDVTEPVLIVTDAVAEELGVALGRAYHTDTHMQCKVRC